MASIVETAHAKINLALHVTGQRADGYHLLDTLVTFTALGDRITVDPAETDRFSMSGPFAAGLDGEDHSGNLVIRARDGLRHLLEAEGRGAPPVHIHLEKNLPVSSGIGGGSADAAATLRALMTLWSFRPQAGALEALALSLGADVPMCLVSRPLIARGIGERIERAEIPSLPILLVNPLRPVSTPQIFRLLARKDNDAMHVDAEQMGRAPADALRPLRNDLQPPAEQLEPLIADAIAALEEQGADLSRMSGSGATCFGLFSSRTGLERAATTLSARYPHWFVAATETLA